MDDIERCLALLALYGVMSSVFLLDCEAAFVVLMPCEIHAYFRKMFMIVGTSCLAIVCTLSTIYVRILDAR